MPHGHDQPAARAASKEAASPPITPERTAQATGPPLGLAWRGQRGEENGPWGQEARAGQGLPRHSHAARNPAMARMETTRTPRELAR